MNKNDLFRMIEVGANVQQSVKLRSLEKQMQNQMELQQEQYRVEQEKKQRQLQIKDLVFKVKTAFDEVTEENDMLVRSVLLSKLLSVINQNKITVEEFEAISDKEYAHTILQALENTLDDAFSRLTESDEKDLDDLSELKVSLDTFDEKLNSLLLQQESEKEKLAPLLAQQEDEKEKLASLLAQQEGEKLVKSGAAGNTIPKPNLKNPVRFSLGGFGLLIFGRIIDIPALGAIGLPVSFFSLIWLIWRCASHHRWARWALFIFFFPIWLIWLIWSKKERKIQRLKDEIQRLKDEIQKQEDEIQKQSVDLQKIENLVSELEMQRQEILDQRNEIISRHPGLDAQFSPQLSLQR